MKPYTEIPEAEIAFTSPLVQAAVEGFKQAVATHLPDAKLAFFDCGNCKSLHISPGKETGVMLDVAASKWARLSAQ